jgi:hypothetical protein
VKIRKKKRRFFGALRSLKCLFVFEKLSRKLVYFFKYLLTDCQRHPTDFIKTNEKFKFPTEKMLKALVFSIPTSKAIKIYELKDDRPLFAEKEILIIIVPAKSGERERES